MIEKRKLPSGAVSWRVRYYLPGPGRRERSKSFRTRRAAELFDAERRSRGDWTDPACGRLTLFVVWLGFMASKVNLKPSTAAVYRVMWSIHIEPAFGQWPVGRISQEDIARWVVEIAARRSASTTRHAYRVLSLVLDAAVRSRLVPNNAAVGVELPRLVRGDRVVATDSQVEVLADLVGADHGDLVRLLAYTGLRWGEATALRVCDVDLTVRRPHVRCAVVEVDGKLIVGTPKSHRSRKVPLTRRALAAVASRVDGRAPDELLFPSRTGRPLRNSAFRRACSWSKSTAEAGLAGLRIHDLRHTAASLMIKSGATVVDVQRVLGHASAHTTLTVYAHEFGDHLDDVSRRLDDLLSGPYGQNPATRASKESPDNQD